MRRNEKKQLRQGCLIVIAINFIAAIIGFALSSSPGNIYDENFFFTLLLSWLIGITQLAYVLPLIIFFSIKRKWALMKGVILGAAITGLVNVGGCFIFFSGALY